MTPAITALTQAGIPHSVLAYEHDPAAVSYGDEAALRLGLDPAQVYKTLVAASERGELLVAIVPVSTTLDLKALAHAAECRRCTMAEVKAAQRSTGYLVGGISPLGQKKRLRSFIDRSAQALTCIHVSAGRRGLELALAPQDLARLCRAPFVDIARAR